MRIISGLAKGRKLFSPAREGAAIRPTSDRAREALFSIIGREVQNSVVLDLFAGTGALGCEALSRGAKRVCFIDHNKAALELIARNIALIPYGQARCIVHKYDLNRGLGPRHLFTPGAEPFDLIFADPPYLTGLSSKIITSLDSCPNLSAQALVILEENKTFCPPHLSQLANIDKRRYGDTVFFFFRRNTTMSIINAEIEHEQA